MGFKIKPNVIYERSHVFGVLIFEFGMRRVCLAIGRLVSHPC